MNDEQEPSGSGKIEERQDQGKEDCQPEEAMEQEPDQAGWDDETTSVGGASSLEFNFLDDDEVGTKTLAGTTEPAEDEFSTLEPPSVFMSIAHNLPESISPGKSIATKKKLLADSPRRRRLEGADRVPFLGTLPEEVWEITHRDHENRTGCDMDRVAFMMEVWTVLQWYVTQSMLITGLNRLLMREIFDNLDKCKGRMSEFLIDSTTDESEANSPIKATQQESNEEVVYLSKT